MKHKIIYAMALILGLSLFSFNAKAQIWQAYKGIWLNGYDNAPQAPLPPVGYSALTYFADSLGTYVYDWDSLAWLRIPGAGGGGGGGGLSTASNMLSVSPAGNVISGGTATHNTFNHLGNFGLQWSSPTTKLALPPPSSVFPFTQSASFTVGDTASSPVSNFARLYLENVAIDVPTARLTAGSGGNQTSVVLTPTSGSLQFGSTNHVTVVNSQAVLRNGNSQWVVSGGNQRADLTSFIGTNSGLRFSIGSTSESIIQTIPSGDNLRFTTNNGNIVLDDPVILQQEPAQLDTATWFLARRNSDGAIVQRQSSGGGGGLTTADNGLNASSATNVRLGGTLVQNTTVPLGGFGLTIGQAPDNTIFVVDDGGNTITANVSAGSAGALFNMSGTNVALQHSGSTGTATITLDQAVETATVSSASGSALDINVSNANTVTLLADGGGNSQIVAQSQGAAGLLRVNNTAGGGRLFVGNTAATNDNIISVEDAGGSISLSTDHGLGSYPAQLALRGENDDMMIHAGSGSTLNILSAGGGDILIDAGTGNMIILNIPTSDPCGSAPSGTVWSNSNVLTICP